MCKQCESHHHAKIACFIITHQLQFSTLLDQLPALHSGGFNTAVEDYQTLLSLARSQGAVGGQNRGACKICGQLGHLTKQCRNHLSAHFQMPGSADGAAAAANGKPLMPTLPTVAGDQEDLSSDLSDLESSDSDSSSESEDERRRRKVSHPAYAAAMLYALLPVRCIDICLHLIACLYVPLRCNLDCWLCGQCNY